MKASQNEIAAAKQHKTACLEFETSTKADAKELANRRAELEKELDLADTVTVREKIDLLDVEIEANISLQAYAARRVRVAENKLAEMLRPQI